MAAGGKRDASMLVVTGQQEVGKTWLTLKFLIEEYIKNNPATGSKARKALIFDTNFEFPQFTKLAVKDIKRFAMQTPIEIRKIVPLNKDNTISSFKEKTEILKKILANFVKGLILLEDINTYLIGAKEEDIIAALVSLRHRETDVIIHYQTLAKVPTLMFENASAIRMHKQQESIDRYKDRIPYYEIIKIGEYLVNAQYYLGNIYFHCYVSSKKSYIRGEFKKEDLREACQKYVERNPPELTSLIKTYKEKAEISNPRAEAIKELTDELMNKYNR